jgi:hypothetical protein
MSNTIKLIIEIPKSDYNAICTNKESAIIAHDTCRRIAQGIPFDDIRAKIADIETYERDGYWVMADVWKVLNDIDKAYTHNVNKMNFAEGDKNKTCCADTGGKSCNTCKNSDDELSGECYECIKGIFDHYEPQESEDEDK